MSEPKQDSGTHPTASTNVLSALHSAMTDKTPATQTKPPTPTQARKVPIAPPPITDELYQRGTRTGRSHSMMVRPGTGPSIYGYSVPGQIQGTAAPFDPHAEFQKAIAGTDPNLPKSSIQMEDTSTILHPSRFPQVVNLDLRFASGRDAIGRPRRHTISGSQAIPSAYREKIVKKQTPSDTHTTTPAPTALLVPASGPVPGSAGAPPPTAQMPHLIIKDHPHPSPPRMQKATDAAERRRLRREEREKEKERREKEAKEKEARGEGAAGEKATSDEQKGDGASGDGGEGKQAADGAAAAADADLSSEDETETEDEEPEDFPMPAPSPSVAAFASGPPQVVAGTSTSSGFAFSAAGGPAEDIPIYGLEFAGGVIDFVDHPPTNEDDTAQFNFAQAGAAEEEAESGGGDGGGGEGSSEPTGP